jgi:hypothetical protein
MDLAKHSIAFNCYCLRHIETVIASYSSPSEHYRQLRLILEKKKGFFEELTLTRPLPFLALFSQVLRRQASPSSPSDNTMNCM